MNLLSSLFVIIWAASALREDGGMGSPREVVEMKLAMHVKTTIMEIVEEEAQRR